MPNQCRSLKSRHGDGAYKTRPIPMNDDFAALFTYNRWANAKMVEACRKLTPEQYVAEPVPG